MRQVTWQEFGETLHPHGDQHEQQAFLDSVVKLALRSETAGLILFQNVDFNSSAFGSETVACYGPSRTFKTPADADGGFINDLPSQRQYPQVWVDTTDKATVTPLGLRALVVPANGNEREYKAERLSGYVFQVTCPFCGEVSQAVLPGFAARGKRCVGCQALFVYQTGMAQRR